MGVFVKVFKTIKDIIRKKIQTDGTLFNILTISSPKNLPKKRKDYVLKLRVGLN